MFDTMNSQSLAKVQGGQGSIASSTPTGAYPETPQTSQETLSTALPRLRSTAMMLREYAGKQACSLKGQPMAPGELAPARAGLVGTILDIEDDLRGAARWLDEIDKLLN